MSRKDSFIADQRGTIAFEMPFVIIVLIFSLLLPLADAAIAGFQLVSAWEALRAFGQSIQYAPPPDITNPASWASSALAKADPHFPIPSIELVCGVSTCSAANTVSPKYYSYTTTVTLAPMLLKSVLCTSGNANPCAFTLPYSERFQ
jgi:hypothetical protein